MPGDNGERVMFPHRDFIRSNGNYHNDLHFWKEACDDYPACIPASPEDTPEFREKEKRGA